MNKIDSILFGTKIEYQISDIERKEIPELELAPFFIDGKIKVPDSVQRSGRTPVINAYCRRAKGAIATLYFVLSRADAELTMALWKTYGEPTTTFGPLFGGSQKDRLDRTMIWKFSNCSIFYYPRGFGYLKLLILNNDPEATFFKDYEKIKKQH